jgi:hypothetical protein
MTYSNDSFKKLTAYLKATRAKATEVRHSDLKIHHA